MSYECRLPYVDYSRHVCALTTNSQANLIISRVSAKDTCASVKFELSCTVALYGEFFDSKFIIVGCVVLENTDLCYSCLIH